MKPMFGFINTKDPTLSRRKTAELERAEEERAAFLAEKASLKEQGLDLDAPTERLACPRCKESFDFGDTCPTCQVELVGASAVDTADPVAVEGPDRTWILIYALPGVLALAAGVGIWWMVHSAS